MADTKHVELLRAGPSSWNAWRQNHPGVTPDLDSADLRGSDLQGASLGGAKLSEADLSNANLANADLGSADLWRAILDRADLADANLQGANARAAAFRAASLVRANLCSTNFELADLRGASLHKAELGRTILVDTDLRDAKHLETCLFWAPAGIDSRTLIRSAHLPAPFLRGCGVPEEVIESLPALFPKTIEFYSVLIRSAVEDTSLAERLNTDLQARGIRCWRIKPVPAQAPPAGLDVQLENTFRPDETRLILVLSRHTAHNRTPWLDRDLKLWMQKERAHNRKLLLLVRLDDARLGLRDPASEQEVNRRAMDFRRWKEQNFYVRALEKLASALSS